MSDIGINAQLLKSPDIEKINFWKEKGRLATIPWALLALSGYIEEYAQAEVIGEKDGKIMKGAVYTLPEGTEILFWSPQEKTEKIKLEEILTLLEEKKQAIALVDTIINKFAKVGKEDDVMYLEREKQRIKAPLIIINGRINAFLDTLRFRVSEVGMTELRQYPWAQRLSLEKRERELNDD